MKRYIISVINDVDNRMRVIKRLCSPLIGYGGNSVFPKFTDAFEFVEGKKSLTIDDVRVLDFIITVIGITNISIIEVDLEMEAKIKAEEEKIAKENREAQEWFESLSEQHKTYVNRLMANNVPCG